MQRLIQLVQSDLILHQRNAVNRAHGQAYHRKLIRSWYI